MKPFSERTSSVFTAPSVPGRQGWHGWIGTFRVILQVVKKTGTLECRQALSSLKTRKKQDWKGLPGPTGLTL